ncbi:MAG: YggS family pyridoxal phosphate-dependent enzyme [Oscillospiraceae bacterium]|nr:YggS family pyridoxal phosphate-dependent enzyme [Oscillospiraceae bacterium]MDY3064330.1 YggS family pyridoxal phosphate-dependent enzyme [Oscillospiraceae bacterium]
MMQRTEEMVKERLHDIRKAVEEAAAISGRSSDDVSVMAVTKTVPPVLVNAAIAEGIILLGENRAQELLEKYADYHLDGVQIHFIGHLQTNKVKAIIDKVSCIESVDSLRLIDEIERQAARIGRIMDILLEVNISAQESKGGFSEEEAVQAAAYTLSCAHLHLKGLMCIPDQTESHAAFLRMRRLFDTLRKQYPAMDTLSMGMSGDFADAIRCGSTQIRIGSAIFGEREYRRLS